MLQEVYNDFYQEIARWTVPGNEGVTLELGSGMGNIKKVLSDCLTSDLFPNPWLDRVESAYALNWPDKSGQNLIQVDVFHHLQHPGHALAEMARAVVRGGRLILFDHDMGLLPRLIMRLFHHEPLGFGQAIEWDAPQDFDPSNHPYYAAQANCFRIFVCKEGLSQHVLREWKVVHLGRMPGWKWLLCGGLRGPQLYPDVLLPFIRLLDQGLSLLPSVFASQLVVVLERLPAS